jgi:hypothetical protein
MIGMIAGRSVFKLSMIVLILDPLQMVSEDKAESAVHVLTHRIEHAPS